METGNAILNKYYILRFLWNEDRLSDDYNVVGSSFQMHGAEQRKHAC